MKPEEIIAFAQSHLEVIPSHVEGLSYRCTAYLNDGLYLPCVLIASRRERVSLAVKRFQETQEDAKKPSAQRRWGHGMQYEDIVSNFAAKGNQVNSYDIARLERSAFAIPLSVLKQVKGETSMGWTQFTGVMQDGLEFSFGTSFHTNFFQMPDGYIADDIVQVFSHNRLPGQLFRERPFFVCYIEGI